MGHVSSRRVFSTHLEQVVLALHTAQLIVNGGYKKSEPKKLPSSDEFELKFPELSRAELKGSRAESKHFNFQADKNFGS